MLPRARRDESLAARKEYARDETLQQLLEEQSHALAKLFKEAGGTDDGAKGGARVSLTRFMAVRPPVTLPCYLPCYSRDIATSLATSSCLATPLTLLLLLPCYSSYLATPPSLATSLTLLPLTLLLHPLTKVVTDRGILGEKLLRNSAVSIAQPPSPHPSPPPPPHPSPYP